MANSAIAWGGAVFVQNVDLTVFSSTIGFNEAGFEGGGVHSRNSPPVLPPGAPPPQGSGRKVITFNGTRIIGNKSEMDGGGVYVLFARVSYAGVEVMQNRAARGGGLYANDSAVTFWGPDSDFAYNQATLGRGIYLMPNSAMTSEPRLGGGDDIFCTL